MCGVKPAVAKLEFLMNFFSSLVLLRSCWRDRKTTAAAATQSAAIRIYRFCRYRTPMVVKASPSCCSAASHQSRMVRCVAFATTRDLTWESLYSLPTQQEETEEHSFLSSTADTFNGVRAEAIERANNASCILCPVQKKHTRASSAF